jgi:glycosyltransferase involved in cell wall biosynthesis
MVSEGRQGTSRRVAFVADELLGYAGNGIGTTTTFVSLALARTGHSVEVLYAGRPPTAPVDPEWQRLYDEAGVRVREVPHLTEKVEPGNFARSRDVESALRADPPDVVVVQDLGAPANTALRLRRLGLAFERTSFVVFCHGTRQWITDVSRKMRVLPGALAVTVLERASVELADAVVSPSAYLVDWMRGEGWQLPAHTFVIPHVSRAGATGEPPSAHAHVESERVERVAFFGRLEERKGLRPFLAALNALEPEVLARVDLEFIGRPTPPWPVERVTGLLSESTRRALRSVSFETTLDQHEALAKLLRPGTLAVMPSFEENSPNVVYECLENGIPFIASSAAGIRELVAPEDHARVLFEPTEQAIAQALRSALENGDALRPASPAFDDADSLRRWQEVLALPAASPSPPPPEAPLVDVVVVHRSSEAALDRCLASLAAQRGRDVRVTVVRSEGRPPEEARAAALPALEADWVVFLDEEDVAEPTLVETLVRAQQVSGADIVSCGLFLQDASGARSIHLFPGEPHALGLLANGYGTVALLRRSLLGQAAAEPDWPLLAGLSVAGAKIVSVPIPLVTRTAPPGAVDTHPADARLVAKHAERALPHSLRLLAELAPRLAADMQRPVPAGTRGLARRAARRLLAGLGR